MFCSFRWWRQLKLLKRLNWKFLWLVWAENEHDHYGTLSAFPNLGTHINFHLSIKPIIEEEIVCHPYPMGLHWMPLAVVIVPNITCAGRRNRHRLHLHTDRQTGRQTETHAWLNVGMNEIFVKFLPMNQAWETKSHTTHPHPQSYWQNGVSSYSYVHLK